MKAILCRHYGSPDVLEIEEVEKPSPGAAEVLIKIRASSVNPIDFHFMRGLPYFARIMTGLRKPKPKFMRPGVDVAGQVEAVGSNVTQFKPGDEVFGAVRGAFAEYACAPESSVVIKPANVTFEQAATVAVAGSTALQGLRDTGRIRAGQKVLINGAAGGVGTFAVQIARSFGADVTGVCSGGNAAMVRSIGAGHVIDYTREDFTSGAQKYDLILDCIGNHSFPAIRRVMNPGGRYVAVGGPSGSWMIAVLARMLVAVLSSRFTNRKILAHLAKLKKEDLTVVGELIQTGKITPVIDRRYALTETAEAIRYLEHGHARGKVAVLIDRPE